jgi:hypothetical protein
MEKTGISHAGITRLYCTDVAALPSSLINLLCEGGMLVDRFS